ncbi:hypothetical protein MRX96_056964 [Rhipicephalus microplus]
MLVFVQYEIDSTTEVVEHATVEDVHPKNVADFDGSHIYDVWWSGNENVCGGYYKAKVLHITVCAKTQEEMDLFLSKRSRKTASFVEGEGKKEDEIKGISRVVVISARCGKKVWKLRLENEKLKRQLQLQASKFAVKLQKSQEDLGRARLLNKQLQEAFASKVFESESRIIYATSMNVVVGGRSSCAKPLIGQYRSKRIQRDHCIQYYIPYRISVAWVQAVQISMSSLSAVDTHKNSGKGIPVVTTATSLASVSRSSVDPLGTTEMPMPDRIASQVAMLSSTTQVEPDEFASQDLPMRSPTPAEPDDIGEARTPPESNEGLQTVIGSARDDEKICAGSDKWVEK